jgi:hypothetical protein
MDANNGATDGRVVFPGLPRPVQSVVVVGGRDNQLARAAAEPISNAMMSAARITSEPDLSL